MTTKELERPTQANLGVSLPEPQEEQFRGQKELIRRIQIRLTTAVISSLEENGSLRGIEKDPRLFLKNALSEDEYWILPRISGFDQTKTDTEGVKKNGRKGVVDFLVESLDTTLMSAHEPKAEWKEEGQRSFILEGFHAAKTPEGNSYTVLGVTSKVKRYFYTPNDNAEKAQEGVVPLRKSRRGGRRKSDLVEINYVLTLHEDQGLSPHKIRLISGIPESTIGAYIRKWKKGPDKIPVLKPRFKK